MSEQTLQTEQPPLGRVGLTDLLGGVVGWRPGGARGNTKQQFCDGDQMLIAVQYRSRHKPGQLLYEYRIIVANVDPELGANLVGVDDSYWGWTWDDVEW